MNGPGPSSVSTRPAAFTAATSVVRFLAAEAFCTMFLVGYMAAPPTMGAFCPKAATESTVKVVAISTARIRVIFSHPLSNGFIS